MPTAPGWRSLSFRRGATVNRRIWLSCGKVGFQGIRKSIAMNDAKKCLQVAVEADMQSAHRPQYIAMSFHRLFLGRLLPSRACLRFTGEADNIVPHWLVKFFERRDPR